MVWDKSGNDMTQALNYVLSVIEEIRGVGGCDET